MRRFAPLLIVFAALTAGCGGGSHAAAIPAERAQTAANFAVPPRITHAVPDRRTLSVPALPASIKGSPVANATHQAFFNGENPLTNGVYYLQFPSGKPFGYYSYLSDPHYVFHFDLGYEYFFDSTDPNTQYIYDFASGHFWYTGANIFPYVYDFTLNAFLYYYPDTQRGNGYYTTNPRYFFNFGTNQIIKLPDPLPATDPNCPTGTPSNGSSYTLQSNPSGLSVQRVDPSVTNSKSICFAALTPATDTPPTAPHSWNYVFGATQANPYTVTVSQQLNGNHTLFYNQAGDSVGQVALGSIQSIKRAPAAASRSAANVVHRGIRKFAGAAIDPTAVLVRYRGAAPQARLRSEALARTNGAASGAEITTTGGVYERIMRVPAGSSAAALTATLRAQSDVADVYPVHRRFALTRTALTVTDPHANNVDQWYLYADGFPNAWAYNKGGNAKIAIIDTGIDRNNADLTAKLDFSKGYETLTVQDTNGHGSNTAGIATAFTNNAVGFAGAGYDVRLLAYNIFPDTTASSDVQFASVADEVAAITDAVHTRGADVISLSIGAPQDYDNNNGFDQSEHDAIEDAIAHGVTVVAAAGNDADGGESGTPHTVLDYPAAYDGVIAVGATGLYDNDTGDYNSSSEAVASYSQYGPGLSVVAPGGDPSAGSFSSPLHWIWNYSTSTANFPDDQCHTPSPATSCTAFFAGTSQATPQVAAAAALLISVGGHGSLTPAHVKQLIESTADNINDNRQGHGRLNAYKALAAMYGDVGAYSGPQPQKTGPQQLVAFAYTNSGGQTPQIVDVNYPAGIPVDLSGGFRIADVRPTTGYKVGVWYDANGDGIIDSGDQFGAGPSCSSQSVCAIGTITLSSVGAGFTLP